jgi:hypothetical protein
MKKLDWNSYPVGVVTKVRGSTYVLRTKKVVSDLQPDSEKVFSDRLLTVNGYYNRRGLIVGYAIEFENTPSILHESFYLVLDYVAKGKQPKGMEFPELLSKSDSSISLVKFGRNYDSRMYVFIYRRKQDG